MRFAEVIGQNEVKSMLAKSIDEGRVSHAQLFSGQSGAGALPLALAYVQYLNCTDRRDGDSCGKCASCRKMTNLAHPDLHFIFPTNSKGGGSQKPMSDSFMAEWRHIFATTGGYFDEQMWYNELGLDNQQGLIAKREADEVIKKLSFKSFEADYKSVIIWLPEKMGDEAANSLLKILEEPWPKTLFILVSVMPQKLLPTIISRAQETAVPNIAQEALEQYAVSEKGLEAASAAAMARLANGNVLDMNRLLSASHNESVRENFEYFAQLMRFSYGDKHMDLLDWADAMSSLGRENQKRFLEYSIGMLRESYMLSAGLQNISYLWGGERDFCTKFAPFIGNHNIEQLVKANELALVHIRQNGNPKIVFTHFALSVSKMIVKI